MPRNRRCKHDEKTRRLAVDLFEKGYGERSAASALAVPRETVRQWLYIFRASGLEGLLAMGSKRTKYAYEQKVAAASAVVDDGMAKADAMAGFGIASLAPLERWCRLYREGGAEALSESTPIPLTPFTPPSGGLRLWASWPLRTRRG